MTTININDIDIIRKNQHCESQRRYYLKNRERIIRENTEYSKTYVHHAENSKLYKRLEYYIKKGLFDDIDRDTAKEITQYSINNKLTIKNLEYVKFYIMLPKISRKLAPSSKSLRLGELE